MLKAYTVFRLKIRTVNNLTARNELHCDPHGFLCLEPVSRSANILLFVGNLLKYDRKLEIDDVCRGDFTTSAKNRRNLPKKKSVFCWPHEGYSTVMKATWLMTAMTICIIWCVQHHILRSCCCCRCGKRSLAIPLIIGFDNDTCNAWHVTLAHDCEIVKITSRKQFVAFICWYVNSFACTCACRRIRRAKATYTFFLNSFG